MKTLIVTVIIFLSSLQVVYSQWQPTNGPNEGCVTSITFSGSNIIVGCSRNPASYGGIFYSTNDGMSWIMSNLDEKMGVSSFAVNGNNVFAGGLRNTYGNFGVYLSTNNGMNWTQTSLNNQSVTSLVIKENNIFAGTIGSGLYLSTNNGLSWVQTALNNNYVYSLAVSGNTLLAGTIDSGIYLSTDNGMNWIRSNFNSGSIWSFAVKDSYIFAAGRRLSLQEGGVYVSTDNGVNWNLTSMNDKYVLEIEISGNTIYAATDNYGVFLSTDNGTSWSQTSLNSISIFSLGANENKIYAGGYGLYLSTDSGSDWDRIGINYLSIYSLAANGNNIFAGSYIADYYHYPRGLYVSEINGTSWMKTGLGSGNVISLAIKGNIIFAGCERKDHISGGGLFLSTNNGTNWAETLSNHSIWSLVVNGNNIYAAASGVQRSTDNGLSWIETSLNEYVISLAANTENIFAGTYSKGVFMSTNSGDNWTKTTMPNIKVYTLAANGNNIYAGCYDYPLSESGVYVSTDNGQNWELRLSNKHVFSLAISGNNIFAGCYHDAPNYLGGIYISTNNGTTWIEKNEGLENLTIRSLLIDDDYIYAGTDGNSVWKRRLSEIISGSHDFSAGPFIDFPEVFIKDSSYHIKAKITNEGRVPETNVPIRFLINGTQVGYYLRSLPAGGIDTVDFTWTPHTAGDFNVAIASALPTDINRSNDTVMADVRVYSSPALPIFCDDFSGGTANWTITNNGGTCVWQAYSPPYPNAYSLPATSTGAVLSADADDCGSGTTLLSTATIIENVDCSMYENVYLEFDNDWNAEDNEDSAIVEVSYDGGSSWSSVIAWGGTDVRNSQERQSLTGADANPNVRIRFRSIQPGWDWWWAIDNVCIKGFPLTGLTQNNSIPTKYALMQNYPNPFNPTTKIEFTLPKSAQAKLIIYDILGREVATLVNEKLSAGSYIIDWDGSSYPSGIYFYRLETNDFNSVKKMLMIK